MKIFSSRFIGALLAIVTYAFGVEVSAAMPSQAPRQPAPQAKARHQVTGQEITYEIRDGLAIVGGDIVVGTHAKVQAEGIRPWTPKWRSMPGGTSGAAAITSGSFWTANTLYYQFDASLPQAARDAFTAATKIISDKSNVKFVKRTNQANYVNVVPGGGCYSYLGMIGGAQDLSLGLGCEIAGIAVHEIMHALGYQHEHQRPDRDAYITVLFENVNPAYVSQLAVLQDSETRLLTVYDYDSVMHYPTWAFSANGQPVIVPKNGVDPERLGKLVYHEPYGLSPGDVSALAQIYAGPPPAWSSSKLYKHGEVVSYKNANYTMVIVDSGTGLPSPLALKGIKPTSAPLDDPKFGNPYMAFWLADGESFSNGLLPVPSKCQVKLPVSGSSKFTLLVAGTSLGAAAASTSVDSVVALQSGSKIQKWKASANSDGFYQIVNDTTGLALSATGASEGADILARTAKVDPLQQWCPLKRGDYYELRSRGSGLPAGVAVTRANDALKLTGHAAVLRFKK